jgi:hypothetical protein
MTEYPGREIASVAGVPYFIPSSTNDESFVIAMRISRPAEAYGIF